MIDSLRAARYFYAKNRRRGESRTRSVAEALDGMIAVATINALDGVGR